MAQHPAARRVHQKDATSIDDALMVRAFEASTWASRNQGKIVPAVIAVLVLALVFLWYGRYRNQVADRATTELTRVRATVQSGNAPLAISDLEKYLASFGNTKTADEARLMLAQQYLVATQTDKAISTIEPLAGKESTTEGAQASFVLAQAYEQAKSTDKAEKLYTTLSTNAPFLYMKQDAMDNAARLHAERGDWAGAAELLQKLIEMTPETAPERDVFQLRLGEALAAAGKPVAVTPAIK
jgi:predicted negative regulator of RcsB-dependent stress response